ncbi:hypothetical protein WJT74_08285 [Sphingomicrobium sp. XHP0239]|uniref:hypothetical protein n=1 Tax=Sphingomicrobium maritimum TaxID=3133972 RepID=UPI0031CCA00E
MIRPIHLLAPFLLGLAACDMAGEMAKDQLGEQARAAFVERCEGVAANVGFSNDTLTPVCGCSADRLLEKDVSELAQVDRARIEQILSECASEQGLSPNRPEGLEPPPENSF